MQALDNGDRSAADMASAQMDAGLWRENQDEQNAAKATPDAEIAKAAPAKAAAKPPSAPLNPDADLDPLVTTLSIASRELRAGVLLAQGNTDAAKKIYSVAIEAEKKLGYHEPPFYIRPVAETEAEALLRAKDYAGAKTAYQAALVERPQSGWELYGIAHADELAGNTAAAQTEYAVFLKAWPSADSTLPEVTHARAAVGASGTAAGQ
jgi:tetratricopeptide (TPR) repeat protein